MLETFQATLTPMLTLFACILLGVIADKKGLAPPETVAALSKIETNIVVPALCLDTFMTYCTPQSLGEHADLVLYSIGILLVVVPLAIWLSGRFTKHPYQRGIYQYALAFGNYGFMGNAIVLTMLGSQVLYQYLLFTLPVQMLANTWGITILTPREKRTGNWVKKLINPVSVCILLGVALGLTGLNRYVPAFITTAAQSIAGCMGPIAMLLTGFVIGGYDLKELLRNGRVYIASVLRLLVIPLIYLIALRLLGAGERVLAMTLFAFGTPLGLNTVIFPASFGGETHTGAAMAMISHTLSVLTIPVMYALLSRMA